MSYEADEMMSVAAARALRDVNACFVGIGLPSTGANLARRTHAPDLVLVYEAGAIGAKPPRLPLSIGDGMLGETADAIVGVPEMFNYWVQPGRIDVGFLGAAQIDRFANINTTVIGGDYDHPKVRLPGAGGAPEIAASCGEVIVIVRQSTRAFVDVAAARALRDAQRVLRRHRAAEHRREPRAPARTTPTSCSSTSPARSAPSRRGCRSRIGDGELAETADAVVGVPEMFNYWIQPGRIDVGFLGAAQIDRFANLNSTVIGGDYDDPKMRLPGAGGAPEIAASCGEVIVIVRQSTARVRRAGRLRHLRRPRQRPGRPRELGLRGKGPTTVITDLGILEPDPETASSC